MIKPPGGGPASWSARGAKCQFHQGVSIYIAPSPSSAFDIELTSVLVLLVSAPKKGRGRQPEDRAQQPIPLRHGGHGSGMSF